MHRTKPLNGEAQAQGTAAAAASDVSLPVQNNQILAQSLGVLADFRQQLEQQVQKEQASE